MGLFRLISPVFQARLACLKFAPPVRISMLESRKTKTRRLPVIILGFFIALIFVPFRLISVTKKR